MLLSVRMKISPIADEAFPGKFQFMAIVTAWDVSIWMLYSN